MTTTTSQPTLCPNCGKENSPRARFCQHCGQDVILNNVGPRFVLTRRIKAGGQGAVYEGRGEDGTIYAVKEMLDNLSDPAERAAAVARFDAEAELLASLSDPRIPRVHAVFHDEGRHYLVMDFIRGEDLDEVVTREGAQPEARVLAWADEICDVLGRLHARGIVYRDMKPGNVMLERNGQLKLIDFGIAKVFQATVRGTQIGTPGYAPPEQYQGLATPASDVFALGATLYHLLSGRDPQQHPPFNFPPLRTLNPAISARTEAAIARALQMRPEDRFATMEEFRQALIPAQAAPAQVIAQAPAPARPAPTPARPAPTPARPAPKPAAAAAPSMPAPTVPGGQPGSARPVPAAPAAAPNSARSSPQAAPQVPVPAPAPAAPARSRGRGCTVGAVLLLLVLAFGGAAAYFIASPAATSPAGPTATSVPLVEDTFVRRVEIRVPNGSGDAAINQAFQAAFLALARQDCGCEPQIVAGTLVYLNGAGPQRIRHNETETTYQASLQATLLVPQR